MYYFSVFTSVIALTIILSKRANIWFYNLFLLLYLISVFCSILNLYLKFVFQEAWLEIGIFYRYVELFTLLLFYSSIFLEERKKFGKYIIASLGILFAALLSNIYGVSMRVNNSVIFIILGLVIFWKLVVNLETDRIQDNPIFWINSAFFISFCGTFFLHLTRSYLLEYYYDEYPYIFSLNSLFTVVKNIFIVIAFYKVRNLKFNELSSS